MCLYVHIIYFTKTKGLRVQAMRKEANEVFENNKHHHNAIKTIAKVFLCNRECSLQEAAYHIFPELKLRRIFLAVTFLTQIFQRKCSKYYFQKKNLEN